MHSLKEIKAKVAQNIDRVLIGTGAGLIATGIASGTYEGWNATKQLDLNEQIAAQVQSLPHGLEGLTTWGDILNTQDEYQEALKAAGAVDPDPDFAPASIVLAAGFLTIAAGNVIRVGKTYVEEEIDHNTDAQQ